MKQEQLNVWKSAAQKSDGLVRIYAEDLLAIIALAERALLAAAPAPIQKEQSEWRIVPVEPTRDMWTAANKADDAAYAGGSQHGADIATLWEAMLDAAPVRPTQQATTIPNENNDLSNKNESEEAASVPPALAGSQVQDGD